MEWHHTIAVLLQLAIGFSALMAGLSISPVRLLFSPPLERNDFRSFAGASSQSFFQARRSTVLFQEIAERLVGQLLKGLHAFGPKQPELLPGLVMKLHPFADHD